MPLPDLAPSHTKPPIILVTPDLAVPAEAWSEREYVVRANYAEAIREAGGIPLIQPYDRQNLAAVLDLADGVMLTGTTPGYEAAGERRAFERELIRHTLEADKPLLGICHGMQLIGEWLGGTLTTRLPDRSDVTVDHMPGSVPDRAAHAITIEPGSLLATLLGGGSAEVNSLHRHALTGTGRFRVTARAPDGVIEAVEGVTDVFCLGVQWHPEYGQSAFDRAILLAFVQHSALYASRQVPTQFEASGHETTLAYCLHTELAGFSKSTTLSGYQDK